MSEAELEDSNVGEYDLLLFEMDALDNSDDCDDLRLCAFCEQQQQQHILFLSQQFNTEPDALKSY